MLGGIGRTGLGDVSAGNELGRVAPPLQLELTRSGVFNRYSVGFGLAPLVLAPFSE